MRVGKRRRFLLAKKEIRDTFKELELHPEMR